MVKGVRLIPVLNSEILDYSFVGGAMRLTCRTHPPLILKPSYEILYVWTELLPMDGILVEGS